VRKPKAFGVVAGPVSGSAFPPARVAGEPRRIEPRRAFVNRSAKGRVRVRSKPF
jgi:hypothetical protein